MKLDDNKSRSVIIGVAALIVGVTIGVAGTQLRSKTSSADKTAAVDTNQMALALFGGPNVTDPSQWDPFQEIQRMQAQMDRDFNEMFQQFRTQPQFNAFQANPNYSLSLNMQDLKDRYEVRAYLPDAKASDVHVTLENGQSLKVEVNSKQTPSSAQTNQTSQVAEWGQYEQVIQLPTPANADQMKVKHEGHELIITIPKTG